jgi:hypothetical protein
VLLILLCACGAAVHAATFTVTNLNDSGPGSLRQAILDANNQAGPDVIVFESSLSGTIQLQSVLPPISEAVQLIGPGADKVTIRRFTGGDYRIFFVQSGPTTISGLTISNGSVTGGGNGGGLYSTTMNITLAGLVFDGNAASRGGGVYVTGNNLLIQDCTFKNNVSSSNGGGLYVYLNAPNGLQRIERSTFSGNSGNGGGAYAGSNTPTAMQHFSNCTFTGNLSTVGTNSAGGVVVDAVGTVLFTNVTVAGNSTPSTGSANLGGIRSSGSSPPRLRNSIVADNFRGTIPTDLSGNFQSLGHNLIGDPSGGSIIEQPGDVFGMAGSPIDPMLGALGDHGGATFTLPLLAGSPAINAGSAVGAPERDQRGQGRLGEPDIGAYEYAPSSPALAAFRDGAAVQNGGTDSLGGHFGAGEPNPLTYTLMNVGGSTLVLSNPAGIGSLQNCTVVIDSAPLGHIPAQTSTSTVLRITPAAPGPFSFTYSIGSNDAGNDPYTWTIEGTATAPAPGMRVERNGNLVPSGGADDVGTLFAAGVNSDITYAIQNTGSATLTLTGSLSISAQANCTVTITSGPATTVTAHSGTAATLRIQPSGLGAFSFQVSIASNDSAQNPYTWTISGLSTAAAPSIRISRAGTPIPSGGSDALGPRTPAAAFTVNYDVGNVGTGDLTMTNPPTIALALNCTVTVTQPPATTVSPGQGSAFTLEVTPTSSGPFSFQVRLQSNDSTANPYTFLAGGSGGVPQLAVSRNAVPIAPGGSDVVSGASPATPITLEYVLANDGANSLSITTPVDAPNNLNNCTAVITMQPSSALGPSMVALLVVEVTPSAAGTFGGTISVQSDDGAQSTYTWTFTGTAEVALPVISVTRNGSGIAPGGTDTMGVVPTGVVRTITYTIENSGTEPLELTGSPNLVDVSAGSNITSVSVAVPPSSPVGVGASSSFTIEYEMTSDAAFDFSVSIDSNDPATPAYTWTVSGTGGSQIPVMGVARGSSSVPGSSVDNVGNLPVGQASSMVYTIENTGTADLELTGATLVAITGVVNCTATVTTAPTATIGPMGSETFTIEVTPTAAGAFTFHITIESNDPGAASYQWTVLGTGTSGNGGSSSSSENGCSTSEHSSPWLLLIALALALLLPTRLRRIRGARS